jgi:hypothetical protein
MQDLQMVFDRPTTMKTPLKQLPQNKINSLEIQSLKVQQPAMAVGKISGLSVDDDMLGRLARFHERTVLSIGTEESAKIFQKVAAQILFSVGQFANLHPQSLNQSSTHMSCI